MRDQPRKVVRWRRSQTLEALPRRPQLACAACALAARDMLRGRATRLPPEPPLDARGLKMEIWY